MKRLFKIVIPFLTYATLLSGCATGTMIATEPIVSRSIYTTAYPPGLAKYNIPVLPDGYIRLYIYRPQTFIGMMDNPVVTINGKPIGNLENPSYENLFLPGAIFVLDTPGDIALVSWVWPHYKTGRVLSLSSTESRTWYLRWHIPALNFPGERYLEVTPQETAAREIEQLRYTGYVKLTAP
jgi:hypothetical protein